jgi:hypothetical protein
MKAMSFVVVSTFALCFPTFHAVTAQQPAADCDQCGCEIHCRKVCRLVREEKKVEVVCYGCEYEEICLPGPSTPKCSHCKCIECSCADGVNDKVRSKPKIFVWTEWFPGSSKLHTRKKLMKRTTTVTIPSYTWVVEDVCDTCEHQLRSIGLSTEVLLPPVPVEWSALPRVANVDDCDAMPVSVH